MIPVQKRKRVVQKMCKYSIEICQFIFYIIYEKTFSVDPAAVLQQANKGLVSLRHYVESHNGRISDEVNYFKHRLIEDLNVFVIERLFNWIQIWFIGLFKF